MTLVSVSSEIRIYQKRKLENHQTSKLERNSQQGGRINSRGNLNRDVIEAMRIKNFLNSDPQC